MAAKIITVANQKGGSGKTCIAMNLAGSLGARGFKVVVVDGDVQGTATSWKSVAPEEKPFPALVMNLAAAGVNFARPVKEIAADPDIDVVVIDTPPQLDSPVMLQALVIAHLALVPMIPAPGDLWATAPLMRVLTQVRATNNDLIVRVVPNSVTTTTTAQDALELLGELDLEQTKTLIHRRTAYSQAVGMGCTVLELKDPKAAEELQALSDEVLALLGMPLKKKPTARRANA